MESGSEAATQDFDLEQLNQYDAVAAATAGARNSNE